MRRDDAPTAAADARRRLKPRTRVLYRVAGLPIAARALFGRRRTPEAAIRGAFARRYWRPRGAEEWAELGLALALWPAYVLTQAIRWTRRNGAIVARREGRPRHRQFLDQVRLYFAAGVLPRWYYIFDLYRRPGTSHARSFIYRWESKTGIYPLLREIRPPAFDIADKVAFAQECGRKGIAAIPVIAIAQDGKVEWTGSQSDLEADWFVKPVVGRGGKSIERWDYAGEGRFRGSAGERVHRDALLERLAAESPAVPRFVQPRVENHAELEDVNNGALATIRALTCLNESGEPELLGAAMRMAIGSNRVVDNFHAGGIAAAIDLETGVLGPATNLGADARLGWLDSHPTSGAPIRGRRIPDWDRFGPFVVAAHRAFPDRTLIGWDVAITPTGPVVVEANGSPDLDIMQRTTRRGWMRERLGQLLAHHVGDPE